MPLINVRGVNFFYQEAGKGLPILLIHGGLVMRMCGHPSSNHSSAITA